MRDDDYPLYQRPPQVVEMEIWSTNGPGDYVYLFNDEFGLPKEADFMVPFYDIQSQLPDPYAEDYDWRRDPILGRKVKVRFV